MNNEINILPVESMSLKGGSEPTNKQRVVESIKATKVISSGDVAFQVDKRSESVKKPESLDRVVSDLNSLVQDFRRELQFTVDKESGETVVKIIDKENDEVIRQIPSEEVLSMRRRLEEMRGVIFNGSA